MKKYILISLVFLGSNAMAAQSFSTTIETSVAKYKITAENDFYIVTEAQGKASVTHSVDYENSGSYPYCSSNLRAEDLSLYKVQVTNLKTKNTETITGYLTFDMADFRTKPLGGVVKPNGLSDDVKNCAPVEYPSATYVTESFAGFKNSSLWCPEFKESNLSVCLSFVIQGDVVNFGGNQYALHNFSILNVSPQSYWVRRTAKSQESGVLKF